MASGHLPQQVQTELGLLSSLQTEFVYQINKKIKQVQQSTKLIQDEMSNLDKYKF